MKTKDDKKVEIIFEATLNLIEERGISGVSIDLIAKRAKLATGTIYIYFKNKEELINKLYIHTKKSFYESLVFNFDKNEPFKPSFKKIWMNLLNTMTKNYRENIFHEQYQHSQYSNDETKKISNEMFRPIFEILERGKKETLIKDIDTYLICAYIFGCIRELTNLKKFTGSDLNNELIESYFTLCWDGVKS